MARFSRPSAPPPTGPTDAARPPLPGLSGYAERSNRSSPPASWPALRPTWVGRLVPALPALCRLGHWAERLHSSSRTNEYRCGPLICGDDYRPDRSGSAGNVADHPHSAISGTNSRARPPITRSVSDAPGWTLPGVNPMATTPLIRRPRFRPASRMTHASPPSALTGRVRSTQNLPVTGKVRGSAETVIVIFVATKA